MRNIQKSRWAIAQEAEMDYWRSVNFAEMLRICAEKPRFLGQLGEPLLEELTDGKEVLEIGCGPLGLSLLSFTAHKFRLKRLVKTDPLPLLPIAAAKFGEDPLAKPLIAWIESLAREGEYLQTPAEDLAFDSCFDSIVAYNVLDHVWEPGRILRKAWKALRPRGLLVVAVDCFSAAGRVKFEHFTRRRFKDSVLVQAHPYCFVPGGVENLLEGAGFQVFQRLGIPGWVRRLAGGSFRCGFAARKS